MANGNGLNGQGKSKDLVSISQAASILGVSIDTVRRWDKAGTLSSSRPDGKNRYFSVDELQKVKLDQPLSISEAARTLKISPSTLRRLEAKGLISPIRNGHGERLYDRHTLEKFLDSEYFIRQKEVEEEVLEPLKTQADNEETVKQPGAELAIRQLVTDHHADIHTLHRRWRLALGILAAIVIPVLLLITGLTAALLISPESAGKSLGIINPTGNNIKLKPLQSWKYSLRPFIRAALTLVSAADKGKYAIATQDYKIPDVNSVFGTTQTGQVKSVYTLSLDSTKLDITNQALIVNLNSDLVQGRRPGTNQGDLAILPIKGGPGGEIADGSITTFNIANGSITGEKLAPGLVLESGVPTTTTVVNSTSGSSISEIVAGNGLVGGGSSGSITLSAVAGKVLV